MSEHRTKSRSAKPDAAAVLSFVAKRDKKGTKLVPYDFWSVEETGDFVADCNEGVRLAEEFLRELNAKNSMAKLGWIVRDMIAKGRFSGLEVGFFSRISWACVDDPFLRLTADHSVPPFTKAVFEKHYAEQTRKHRERTGQRAS